MAVSMTLKKSLRLALMVWAVVLLAHGPEFTGWLRAKLAGQIGASADDVSVWQGELQLNAAHVCPPSWLSRNDGGNLQTRVFAPLNVDGMRKAWIEIPLRHTWSGSSGIGAQLLTHLPREEVTIKHIQNPLIREGIQGQMRPDVASVRSMSAEIKLCPTPGRRSLVPERSDLILGTLWSGRADMGSMTGPNTTGRLFVRMLITWFVLFVVLWLLRAKPWLKRATNRRGRRAGNTTLVDMPARLSNLIRYMPGTMLARLLFCLVLMGALLNLVYDVSLWRARSGSKEVPSIAKSGDLGATHYGPLAGTSRAVDAVVCSKEALDFLEIDADFTTDSVLFVLVDAGPKPSNRTHLAVLPVDGRNHLMVKALLRHKMIPMHSYGYAAPLRKPALLLRDQSYCSGLVRTMAGRWGQARTVFVVDPRPPSQYRTELLGLILLVLLVGGAMGYAWSMVTFRRWWQRRSAKDE